MSNDSTPPTPLDPRSLQYHLLGAITLIEDALRSGNRDSGWASGGPDLLASSPRVPALHLVLGASGSGKTALAAGLLSNLLAKEEHQQPLAWFNSGESAALAAVRLRCLPLRMPLSRVVAGELKSKSDLSSISRKACALSRLPVYIDDTPSLQVEELISRCWSRAGQEGYRLILIDPLEDLLDREGNAWDSSSQARRDITESLLRLGRELGAVVVCFATTPTEPADSGAAPSLDSLPDSLTPIVAEADLVAFLENGDHRPGDLVVPASLRLLKQNYTWHPDVIPLMFHPGLLRFDSAG